MINIFKKSRAKCKFCGVDTRLMNKPVYSKKNKGKFCDMDCFHKFEMEKKEGK